MPIELTQELSGRLAGDDYRWLATVAKSSSTAGSGIIVVGGTAAVESENADPRDDGPYWAKYAGTAAQFGLTEAMAGYPVRLRISVDKVWTTPTA
jgi:hypothetical protein